MAVLSSTMASSAATSLSKKRKRSSSSLSSSSLSSGVLLSSILLSLLFLLTVVSASQESVVSPFWMIVDGGSTGSRVHLFEFVPKTEHADRDSDDDDDDEYTLERRGSARADEPLSAYGRTTAQQLEQPLDPATVAAHLLPALQEMQELVPVPYRKHTRVRYLATAGMRLLAPSEQEAVYDALYTGLIQAPALQLQVVRQDILTLSGELEGYYGAVAANYLHGTVNTQLEWTHTDAALRQPIGALDMGGSSTQIVFLPQPQQDDQSAACLESLHPSDRDDKESLLQQQQQEQQSTTCHTAAESELPSRLNGHDFFATSYLSYGVDQFRARFYETLVREHVLQHGHDDAAKVCDACRIDNPCAFRGHEMEWASNNQVAYTLVGTGQAEVCAKQVSRLIPHPTAVVNHSDDDESEHQHDHVVKLGSHVGGVEHPPVRGKFFAMSLYFFTLDSLRELSHAHHVNDAEQSHSSKQAHEALNRAWPTPSIRELTQALPGLCSRSWHDDLALIADTAHTFTRPAVLPHRCFEAVYMVTLLREGFGFEDDSRDITFLFLVDGSEVEWTLGMALALFAEQLQEQSANAQNQDSTNATDQDAEPPSDAPSERRLWDRLAKQILLSSW